MRILIATDGSDYSEAAIDRACEMLRPDNAVLKVVSVFENPPPVMTDAGISTEYYQQVAEELREMAEANIADAEKRLRKIFAGQNVELSSEVLNGPPDREIIEEARKWNADVIVVGSHGRGFWGRLLGSVSNGVVHHAPCAVLVVRKPPEKE